MLVNAIRSRRRSPEAVTKVDEICSGETLGRNFGNQSCRWCVHPWKLDPKISSNFTDTDWYASDPGPWRSLCNLMRHNRRHNLANFNQWVMIIYYRTLCGLVKIQQHSTRCKCHHMCQQPLFGSKLSGLIWQIYDVNLVSLRTDRPCGALCLCQSNQSECATEITAWRIIFTLSSESDRGCRYVDVGSIPSTSATLPPSSCSIRLAFDEASYQTVACF